jgi:hypothetical protein
MYLFVYLFVFICLFVSFFDLQVHVDHGGLHPDFCEITVQKERPSPYNVVWCISGELLIWSQIVSRNRPLNFEIDSEIVSVILLKPIGNKNYSSLYRVQGTFTVSTFILFAVIC